MVASVIRSTTGNNPPYGPIVRGVAPQCRNPSSSSRAILPTCPTPVTRTSLQTNSTSHPRDMGFGSAFRVPFTPPVAYTGRIRQNHRHTGETAHINRRGTVPQQERRDAREHPARQHTSVSTSQPKNHVDERIRNPEKIPSELRIPCTTLVGEGGLEPPRPEGHWHLKPARLPFRHSPERRERQYHGVAREVKSLLGVITRRPYRRRELVPASGSYRYSPTWIPCRQRAR